MPEITDAAVHLQEDLLHDVFEIRLAAQHALSQSRDVLTVLAEQLPKRLGIAALAALHEARGFHVVDFNSDRACWLALAYVLPPFGTVGRGGYYRQRQGERSCQPCLWCAAPAAFSRGRSEKRLQVCRALFLLLEHVVHGRAAGDSWTGRKSPCQRRRPRAHDPWPGDRSAASWLLGAFDRLGFALFGLAARETLARSSGRRRSSSREAAATRRGSILLAVRNSENLLAMGFCSVTRVGPALRERGGRTI